MIEQTSQLMFQTASRFAREGQWDELCQFVAQAPSQPDTVLQRARWHAQALRALGRGAEANFVLLEASRQPYQASAADLSAFASDLVAALHLSAAAKCAKRLESVGSLYAHLVWCMIWREREDWARAEQALSHFSKIEQAPWSVAARMQAAWCALRQGRASMALQYLQPLKEQTAPDVHKLLARVELALGLFSEATSRLTQVAAAVPADWEWPALLAAAQTPTLWQTQPNKLVEAYVKALQRQPSQADALINFARLLHLLGNKAQAAVHLTAACNLKPWLDAPVLLQSDWLLSERKTAEAVKLLDLALAQHVTPKRVAARLDVLRLTNDMSAQNRCKNARDAIARHSANTVVLRSAGALLQSAKQLDEAAVIYESAIALDPSDVGVVNNLAVLYRDRGDRDQAIALWRSVLPLADASVRLSYAHALVERGGRVEAERIFMQVLASQPDNASALRGMAAVHMLAGQYEQAMLHAQRAVQAEQVNPQGWVMMSQLQMAMGQFAQAEQALLQGLHRAKPELPVQQQLHKLWMQNKPPHQVLTLVGQWLIQQPDEVEHWLMAANAANNVLRFDDAEQHLLQACKIDLTKGGTHLVRFYLGRSRSDDARKVAEQLVHDQPHVMKHWGLLAEVYYRQERVDDALDTLAEGLAREPDRLALIRQRLSMLMAQERYEQAIVEAQAFYQRKAEAIRLQMYTEVLTRAQHNDECAVVTGREYAAKPRDLAVAMEYASALRRVQRYPEAISVLATLRQNEPDNIVVMKAEVALLFELDCINDALKIMQSFAQEVADKPDVLQLLVQYVRESGGGIDAAQVVLAKARSLHPTHLGLQVAEAKIRCELNQFEGARSAWHQISKQHHISMWVVEALDQWIVLGMEDELRALLVAWAHCDTTHAAPLRALNKLASLLKLPNQQLEWLNKLEELTGPSVYTLASRASLLNDASKMTEALEYQRKAIALAPADAGLQQGLLSLLVKSGDFDSFDEIFGRLNQLWGDKRHAQYGSMFFNLNCHPTWTAAQIAKLYFSWYEQSVRPRLPPVRAWRNTADAGRRLRIGYLSPDFRRHAVAYFAEPLLVEHDRCQFELYAYAEIDEAKGDAYTARFKTYVHHWRNTRHLTNRELERTIREDGIDILVDLAGHTADNRLGMMVRKPAPVQASWIWGSGQTTGLPQVDWFIADAYSIPLDHERHMSERVIRMSQSGFPHRAPDDILEPMPLPCAHVDEVILGVLARPLRTNRLTIRVWATILHQAPKARLRFDHVPYAESDIQQRMKMVFAEHGIGSDRLIFCNTRPHWQAFREIDLQLDPFPAGSGTTATEGLQMERLVISLESRPPMGRITGAQLHAVGLAEHCLARTEEEYIAKAVALANDPKRLISLSAGLRARVKASWLTDYPGYAKECATLYRQMWQTWCERQQTRDAETID